MIQYLGLIKNSVPCRLPVIHDFVFLIIVVFVSFDFQSTVLVFFRYYIGYIIHVCDCFGIGFEPKVCMAGKVFVCFGHHRVFDICSDMHPGWDETSLVCVISHIMGV